ncbi:MAG: hypothetical protein ACR2LR_15555 [Hassallia sp.]
MIQADTLKPGWSWVKFGDVVRQVKDKVDPQTSGLERYVAGEHMNTDDLRIRCWGEINEDYLGPAFNMRFKPGQVLYGSRRTYLRKVAVPHFEGICANTTFVLEPKDPNLLMPELLPFIMQTEAFHEHSIKQSKGSVNPCVNFSDLAWWECALPPLEQQTKVALFIKATSAVYESHMNVFESIEQLSKSFCKHIVESYPDHTLVNVGNIAKFTSGKQIRVTELPQQPTGDATIPVYGGNGISGYTTVPLPNINGSTVVVGRVGQFCGATHLTKGAVWVTDNALYPAQTDQSLDIRFLAICLKGLNLNRGKLGEYLPLITQKVVHEARIPSLSKQDQQVWIEQYIEINNSLIMARERLQGGRLLYQNILKSFFN